MLFSGINAAFKKPLRKIVFPKEKEKRVQLFTQAWSNPKNEIISNTSKKKKKKKKVKTKDVIKNTDIVQFKEIERSKDEGTLDESVNDDLVLPHRTVNKLHKWPSKSKTKQKIQGNSVQKLLEERDEDIYKQETSSKVDLLSSLISDTKKDGSSNKRSYMVTTESQMIFTRSKSIQENITIDSQSPSNEILSGKLQQWKSEFMQIAEETQKLEKQLQNNVKKPRLLQEDTTKEQYLGRANAVTIDPNIVDKISPRTNQLLIEGRNEAVGISPVNESIKSAIISTSTPALISNTSQHSNNYLPPSDRTLRNTVITPALISKTSQHSNNYLPPSDRTLRNTVITPALISKTSQHSNNFIPPSDRTLRNTNKRQPGPTLEEIENKRKKKREIKSYYRQQRLIEIEREEDKKRIDKQSPCSYYAKYGKCDYGDECRFSHDFEVKKNEVCKYYLNGTCLKGSECIFIHDKWPCKFFHFKGYCNAAEKCRFSHAELTEEKRSLIEAQFAVEESTTFEHPPANIEQTTLANENNNTKEESVEKESIDSSNVNTKETEFQFPSLYSDLS